MTADIIIPDVRNAQGATTSDVIAEQVALCKATLRSIEDIAYFRKAREKRNEINRRLRECHNFLGMAGSRKRGCLYRQVGLYESTLVVCEHAIPVTALVSLYEEGVDFADLVFYPVVRISKEADKCLTKKGFGTSGHDLNFPLLRYYKAGIQIETYAGNPISCNSWSMEEHWKLVETSEKLTSVRNEVLGKLRRS